MANSLKVPAERMQERKEAKNDTLGELEKDIHCLKHRNTKTKGTVNQF